MVRNSGFDASFDAVEMDLLCTFAGVPAPFPLRVRSVGATEMQRLSLFRAARERLTARGLADERGPRGVAAAFANLLRGSRVALDLTLAIGPDRLGATLLGQHGDTVLAVSSLDGPGAPVGVIRLPLDDAIDELLLLVPELEAAMTTPFTLPRRGLAQVFRAMRERARAGLGGMDAYEMDRLLGAHGIDERLARRMTVALQPVLGNGQAGLAERGGYAGDWRRSGAELRWLDTDQGRYKLGGDAEWTSVNPLFPNELYSSIRHLAAVLR